MIILKYFFLETIVELIETKFLQLRLFGARKSFTKIRETYVLFFIVREKYLLLVYCHTYGFLAIQPRDNPLSSHITQIKH